MKCNNVVVNGEINLFTFAVVVVVVVVAIS